MDTASSDVIGSLLTMLIFTTRSSKDDFCKLDAVRIVGEVFGVEEQHALKDVSRMRGTSLYYVHDCYRSNDIVPYGKRSALHSGVYHAFPNGIIMVSCMSSISMDAGVGQLSLASLEAIVSSFFEHVLVCIGDYSSRLGFGTISDITMSSFGNVAGMANLICYTMQTLDKIGDFMVDRHGNCVLVSFSGFTQLGGRIDTLRCGVTPIRIVYGFCSRIVSSCSCTRCVIPLNFRLKRSLIQLSMLEERCLLDYLYSYRMVSLISNFSGDPYLDLPK